MTYLEAVKWATIIASADNGCSSCVKDLCLQARNAFPEWEFWYQDPGRVRVVQKQIATTPASSERS